MEIYTRVTKRIQLAEAAAASPIAGVEVLRWKYCGQK
jgi:hypothetical protein